MNYIEVKDILKQLEQARVDKVNVDDLQDLLVHYYLKTNKIVSEIVDVELNNQQNVSRH